MSRAAHDYYPTPPDVSRALLDWLGFERLNNAWLDPACGHGAILDELPGRCQRLGIEIQPGLAALAAETADQVEVGDALERPWPRANVITNPPFTLLDRFLDLILTRTRHWRRWACVLMRTAVWNAASRATIPLPDHLLLLTWRPSFDGLGTDMHSYSWSVWRPDPTGACTASRLHRPGVPKSSMDAHYRLAQQINVGPMQPELALGPGEVS